MADFSKLPLFIDQYHENPLTLVGLGIAQKHGLAGYIHQVSQGNPKRIPPDPLYATRMGWAAGLGIKYCIGYHFITNEDLNAQFDSYMSHLLGRKPAIDWEGDGRLTASIQQVEQFAAMIKKETGVYPLIYTARWVIQAYAPFVASTTLSQCPLWVCWYDPTPTPTLPANKRGTQYWQTWQLWQYTSSQAGNFPRRMPGIEAAVDISIPNCTAAELPTWWAKLWGIPVEMF